MSGTYSTFVGFDGSDNNVGREAGRHCRLHRVIYFAFN